jgi:hypothetical protein
MDKFPNVRRFPRLAPEDGVAELTARVIRQIYRHRQSRIELGRDLIQLKAKLKARKGHGSWETYFTEKFGPFHLSLRCAQNYMKAARKEDSKNETFRFSKPGGGSHAESIRDAEKRAKAEEAHIRGQQKIQLDKDFRAITTELLKLPLWPRVHKEISDLLNQIATKHGIVPAGKEKRNETVAA